MVHFDSALLGEEDLEIQRTDDVIESGAFTIATAPVKAAMTAVAAKVKRRGDGGGGRHDHCAGASSRAPPPLQPLKKDPVAGGRRECHDGSVVVARGAGDLARDVPLCDRHRPTACARSDHRKGQGRRHAKVAVTIVMSDMVTVQTSVPTHAARSNR